MMTVWPRAVDHLGAGCCDFQEPRGVRANGLDMRSASPERAAAQGCGEGCRCRMWPLNEQCIRSGRVGCQP